MNNFILSIDKLPEPIRKIDYIAPNEDRIQEASVIPHRKEHQFTRILIRETDGTERIENIELGTVFKWRYRKVELNEQ